MSSEEPTAEEVLTYDSGEHAAQPDLRFLHFNDVYHVDASSAEPVGGIARFQHLVNYYRGDDKFKGQSGLLTFFSGDAFNPSLESSVTKGAHMVPVLNGIGTNCACVGNHDLDFGIRQYRNLTSQCTFPWLLANVLDPALGENESLANAPKTHIITSSNGIKVGIIGLAEREWLDTINSLPPNLIYKSATETAKELVPGLREQGAEIVVALTHQRDVNDEKLARNLPEGLVDVILGGHDHFYAHKYINGCHVLRSGSDFKQLSYIEAWRRSGSSKGWDLRIIRRDVVSSIPSDPPTVKLVEKLTSALKSKLEKPVGYSAAPLDARFTTVRLRESNLGNFVCDLMRLHYQGDCCIMAAGTIRGDQIYPPGVLRLKDLMNCFPFEDPVVVIKVTGQAIIEALENSVSKYPALEGRFPQVSNIAFTFSPTSPPMSRVTSATIGSSPINPTQLYRLVTRGYMARGKDGFTSLLIASEGGTAEEIVSEENGILISMMLRQYFMSLKVLGRWKQWGPSMGRHWGSVQEGVGKVHPHHEPRKPGDKVVEAFRRAASGQDDHEQSGLDSEDEEADLKAAATEVSPREREIVIMRKVMRKWWRLTGLDGHPNLCDELGEGEFQINWTKAIAPRLEGRIRMVEVGGAA
ncbi:5'-nucleotidase [Saccharata proteae CBS 121410]|uniref:5'-nucleotidase n=1 Tax=Saccharata proteae CBS 121410 TaxID=1314787 RepID=A0A9P4HZI3_9PEZI|nr:5'-nucleotidase [Saccharata proteae CBS 121410]